MRTTGIICEYNPFHKGHLNHMNRVRSFPDGQYVVCVISSDFVQRGEPAILPKNLRAEAAIMNGADIVFELPSVFSCSSAEYYATSSITMLDRLGVVDSIVFGAENSDISILSKIADILLEEPKEYRKLLRLHLSEGLSYPLARSAALVKYCANPKIADVLSGSNNILGIEYIKAIKKIGAPFKPIAVPRIAKSYKNDNLSGEYPSASAIRKSILEKGVQSVQSYLPKSSYEILNNFYRGKQKIINLEMFRDALFYRLSALSEVELRQFHGVSEGFENRLKSNISAASSLSNFIDACSTKRYPKTRVTRTLFHILIGLRNEEALKIWDTGPMYARILAMSNRGTELIPVIEKNAKIPVFTSLKPFYKISNPSWQNILDWEIRVSDVLSTAAGLSTGREYTMKLNILDNLNNNS